MGIILNKLNKTTIIDGETQVFQTNEVRGELILKQTVEGTEAVKSTASMGVEDFAGCQFLLETENSSSGNINRLRFIDENGVVSDILTSKNGNLTLVDYWDLENEPVSDKNATTKKYVDDKILSLQQNFFIGEYKTIFSSDLILGNQWLLCDGRAILKTDFAELFALIGNMFGETSTTFNLPDARGRVLAAPNATNVLGSYAGADTTNKIPSHTHTMSEVRPFTNSNNLVYSTNNQATSAVAATVGGAVRGFASTTTWDSFSLSGTHSHTINSTGDASVDIRQPTFYGGNLYIKAK